MSEEKHIEPCGCEFTTYAEGNESFTILSRCRCMKHYAEQFKAEWYDKDGFLHIDAIEPKPLILFEGGVK